MSSRPARNTLSDREPLLSSPPSDMVLQEPGYVAGSPAKLLLANNILSPWAMIAQIAFVTWLVTVWVVVIPNPAGLFSYHPPLQTTAIFLFTQGILALQPTRTPGAKRKGLAVHEVFQILGVLVITAGVSIMMANKSLHNAPHFTSWHGKLGLLSFVIVIVQAVFGALIGFKWGRKLLGGEAKAKRYWKYHRVSGYLLFALWTLTALTAVKADWVVGHASLQELNLMSIALIIGVIAVAAGINTKKMW